MKTKQAKGSEVKLHTKQIRVNGTNLSYIERGAGEPVVFIHCEVTDYRTWLEQFEFFSRHYRAICYSRRYHSPNIQANGNPDYSQASHTGDLISFLEALNLGKAHLIGHSYGASIALSAAIKRSDLVGSLVLAEPLPIPNILNGTGLDLFLKQKAGFDEAVRLAQNKNKEEAVRQFLHVCFGVDVWGLLPEERRELVLENASILEPMLRAYYELPNLSCKQLKKVHIPTVLVAGEISTKMARLNNEMINRCLPNSEIAILRSASHGLQMENPEGFNKLVLSFLVKNPIKDSKIHCY